ncbi:MAG: hypothetical protein PVG07_02685 [Acidobacteriota bacterium]|jgi:hypothetical protein
MFELSILLFFGLMAGAALFALFLVGAALKLTFGLLKWILVPVGALVGLVLLVTVGPVLLAVGAVLLCVVLPVVLLCGLLWAGAHLVCLV